MLRVVNHAFADDEVESAIRKGKILQVLAGVSRAILRIFSAVGE